MYVKNVGLFGISYYKIYWFDVGKWTQRFMIIISSPFTLLETIIHTFKVYTTYLFIVIFHNIFNEKVWLRFNERRKRRKIYFKNILENLLKPSRNLTRRESSPNPHLHPPIIPNNQPPINIWGNFSKRHECVGAPVEDRRAGFLSEQR